MYCKDILPRITDYDYKIIKSIYQPTTTTPFNRLSYEFIFQFRWWFSMKRIALFLGVSVRHLYRIMEARVDNGKHHQLAILLIKLHQSPDYETFINWCQNAKIYIRRVIVDE
jgi:hypothetical protein